LKYALGTRFVLDPQNLCDLWNLWILFVPRGTTEVTPYDFRCASRPAQVSGSCASNVAK
jgi:hypothetical protein